MEQSKQTLGQRIKNLWGFFTLYEKTWFFTIATLAIIGAFISPELDDEEVRKCIIGVGGLMTLYVTDVITNILCELLIAKQSKWNFVVSLIVEVLEIAICIVCLGRFATIATTLFFWIPVDIASFVVWHKNPDKAKHELTVVRKLTWKQDILVILGIAVWTVVVGFLLSLIEIEGSIYSGELIDYLDAAASAVGIANGLFILFRYREQWIAWLIVAILETIINIIAGQYVLLVLKVGYLTNTTYGYIKWTQYIKAHKTDKKQIANT